MFPWYKLKPTEFNTDFQLMRDFLRRSLLHTLSDNDNLIIGNNFDLIIAKNNKIFGTVSIILLVEFIPHFL